MAINLTKADESATIDLSKSDSMLEVRAEWVDNGDGRDNDDLDLRCSVLLPGDRMFLVDGDNQGELDAEPFVFHHGDIVTASKNEPGHEAITVARDISKRAGGPVGLVFSVYSALDNGDVAIAALKPVMRMSYGDQVVNCNYDFSSRRQTARIYTYVIGYAVVDGEQVTLAPSGKVSAPNGEETAWPRWLNAELKVEVDGPAVFKGKNAKQADRYNRRAGITKRFENQPDTNTGSGFLSRLLGA